ncbi:hypothetical protein SCUCBS95973_005425 [Sporothrix curviconia]|uniref:Aminoglycoside phosphotransferase domain-containing protein n=1 Tax=Sporothrix curviconia TaxID=1260050 RepID=A0ABP0BXQ6_9PEZI
MAPSYENYDDVAWDYNDALFQAWRKTLLKEDLQRAIARLIMKHRMGGQPVEICAPRKGAFNVHYRLKYMSKPDALARFPIPAYFRSAEEKLAAEVATIRYVADHTTIPLPFVLHHGTREESPRNINGDLMGPFVIMEWVENTGDMGDALNTPGLIREDHPILDPAIDETRLAHLYGQMADVLLQLSQCTFPAIGSLSLATASDYYRALADLHLQQLVYQRNDAVRSARDARKKYVARHLFCKLAAEDRLAGGGSDENGKHERDGPFPLWCDDFRPTNVLVNQDETIAAVIDWEYSYAAPVDFVRCPPWWLLLVAPEDWKGGLDDWAAHYEPRLDTFLRVLALRDDPRSTGAGAGRRLAEHMRASWQTGHFWVVYAAQRTFAFDGIYWRFLDKKFFESGPGSGSGGAASGDIDPDVSYPDDATLEARIDELSPEQVAAMDDFVARKLREKEEGGLVDWYALEASQPVV